MRLRAALQVLFTVLAAALLCPGATFAFTSQWPQSTSDLAANPNVTFGTLPNGLRYAIRRNDTPKGEVSLRLVIEAGSMQEAAGQEGVAHLLEHMAFRGSTHVADGEVIKTLERLGLKFGADTNASTGPQETLYRFDLAQPDAESVDTGMTFLREIASELTLSQDALDSERKVVLAELRQRAGADEDARAAQLTAEFPGASYDRSPGGCPGVIETATPAQLRAFYDAYYRPERAVLVVVGEIDPTAIEAKIKALFSDWQGRGPAGQDPLPYAPSGRSRTVVAHVEPGTGQTNVSFAWIQPYSPEDETRAGRIAAVVQSLGEGAVTIRVNQLNQANHQFITGGMGPLWIPGVARGESMGARGVADLPGAFELLSSVRRQVMTQGVAQAEIDYIVAARRAELQRAAAGSFSGPADITPVMAARLVDEAASGEIDLSEPQQLALFDEAVKGLTADRVNAVLRGQLAGEGPVIFVAGDTQPAGGAVTLEAMLDKADAAPLQAYEPPVAKPWAHTNFGPPGKLAERHEATDLGVTFARFVNGVRLTVKPTQTSPGDVSVLVRFGHGRLDQPRDRLDASDWSTVLLIMGGLDDLKSDEIARALVGHQVSAIADTSDEAFTLGPGMQVAVHDLDLEMQLLAAKFTTPGWRADGWNVVLASTAADDRSAQATPMGVFSRNSMALLHPGDERWVWDTADIRAGWTPAQARAFIEPIMKRSDIEVIIVGDVSPERAIDAVAKTFGAMPKREPLPEPAGTRVEHFPAPTTTPVVLHHQGRADQAVAELSWPTTDRYTGWNDIAPSVILADLLKQRVIDTLRTQDGDTYSPNAGADFSLVFPGWGRISLLVTCKPEAVDRVYAAIDAIAADLSAHSVSADELQRAVKPEVEAASRAQQQNGYWLGGLAGAQIDPRRLDYIRLTLPALSAVTAADVQRVAAKYLRPERAFRIVVLPTPIATASVTKVAPD